MNIIFEITVYYTLIYIFSFEQIYIYCRLFITKMSLQYIKGDEYISSSNHMDVYQLRFFVIKCCFADFVFDWELSLLVVGEIVRKQNKK